MPWAPRQGEPVNRLKPKDIRQQVETVAKRFLRPTRAKQRHEVLVTHGNLIRGLVRLALGDRLSGWQLFGTLQCGITILVLRSKPLKTYLISYNDVGHLPKLMQTAL